MLTALSRRAPKVGKSSAIGVSRDDPRDTPHAPDARARHLSDRETRHWDFGDQRRAKQSDRGNWADLRPFFPESHDPNFRTNHSSTREGDSARANDVDSERKADPRQSLFARTPHIDL